MRLVLLSDTHGFHAQLTIPEGDVLIHAGDFTLHGELDEVAPFDDFLASLPHPHKLVIAGNHDICFEKQPEEATTALKNATYLQDSGCVIEGINFWGSPWQPWFMDMAFNIESDEERAEKWTAIPDNTDVLITHTPPKGILDLTSLEERVGCSALSQAIHARNIKAHIFGHIHEAYGIQREGDITYVNACNCTLQYVAEQAPLLIDI